MDNPTKVQGAWADLALHTLGWKAFQDLCAHVCEDVLGIPVEIYREAQDGGQDAVFVSKSIAGAPINATVQCKFSSQAARSLKPGDLTTEENHIEELKSKGYAETYVFMTSMSVSAPVAIQVKAKLRALGVRRPHVLGKEFLVRVIRASTRLRALVPRVYGLGDLSIILDERKAAQTKALLGHIIPTLKSYVPTAPHVKAVKTLSSHKIVLLVGDPATGKSTIGAVLSTIAADDPNHRSYKADGPLELLENWNPDERGGFYWIDDAFGPNQMREDYVDHWISIMPKIQAAISAGNRFVLTSRRHIYETAKPKLGSRNHPLFRDGRAVVEVGSLTVQERRQILYNHVKAGNQTLGWKSRVRQELETLSHEALLTPEIARQIGDPHYTVNILPTKESLQRFIRHNKEHLLQTIRELSKPHRAALTLIFIHGGQMPIGAPMPEMQELVIRHYNVDRETLAESLIQLRDSFLVEKSDGSRRDWTFKHPTLSDALAATLGEADGMRELYLRGVSQETILSDVICEGMPPIRDAVVVPSTLNSLLLDRLVAAEDDIQHTNTLLFGFLANRASEDVFRGFVVAHSTVFERLSRASYYAAYDPKVEVHARALRMGLLPSERRDAIVYRLESHLFDDIDTSILGEEDVLALFPPKTLMALSRRIQKEILSSIPSRADEIVDQADLDRSPEENFEDLEARLSDLETFFAGNEDVEGALNEALSAVEAGKDLIKNKKEKADIEAAQDDWMWDEIGKQSSKPISVPAASRTDEFVPRSMFSDIAE
jgi:hypothetical protein